VLTEMTADVVDRCVGWKSIQRHAGHRMRRVVDGSRRSDTVGR
jgi:hypothetical protein